MTGRRKNPESLENGAIIFIHKIGDVKVVKHYCAISLLSVINILFTNVFKQIPDIINQPRRQVYFRGGFSNINHN